MRRRLAALPAVVSFAAVFVIVLTLLALPVSRPTGGLVPCPTARTVSPPPTCQAPRPVLVPTVVPTVLRVPVPETVVVTVPGRAPAAPSAAPRSSPRPSSRTAPPRPSRSPSRTPSPSPTCLLVPPVCR